MAISSYLQNIDHSDGLTNSRWMGSEETPPPPISDIYLRLISCFFLVFNVFTTQSDNIFIVSTMCLFVLT